MSPALMVAAIALELASCVCFVVICRLFFGQIPTTQARAGVVPMGSGALLPAGGAGSLAAVGWLLHFAECPQSRLTSAVNVLTLAAAGPRGHGGSQRK